MTHPATTEILSRFLADVAKQPDLCSVTPGPKCPHCGLPFTVARGHSSGKWRVLHAGGPDGRACKRYTDRHLASLTQEAAIELAKQIEET